MKTYTVNSRTGRMMTRMRISRRVSTRRAEVVGAVRINQLFDQINELTKTQTLIANQLSNYMIGNNERLGSLRETVIDINVDLGELIGETE